MKHFFFAVFLIGGCLNGFAQAPAVFRTKTLAGLQAIVDSAQNLTGLMAIDLQSGEKLGINQDMIFTQASAIKIPILMEVYKQASEGKFALTDLRTAAGANVVGGTGVLRLMDDAPSLSIRNMGILMITHSDNTATNVLIDLVGMENINRTMASLGFKNTKVQRKMIDQNASIRGEENLSTPEEAANIMKLLYEGRFVSKQVSDGVLAILQKNPIENSKISRGLPSGTKLAFKPGGMGGVSTEWTIVYMDKRPYAIAVMENYKTDSSTGSFAAISRLVHSYFSRTGNATRYGVIFGQ